VTNYLSRANWTATPFAVPRNRSPLTRSVSGANGQFLPRRSGFGLSCLVARACRQITGRCCAGRNVGWALSIAGMHRPQRQGRNVAGPTHLDPRAVSPAEALHGNYDAQTIFANGYKPGVLHLGVRTDCLCTGDRCMSFFLAPGTALTHRMSSPTGHGPSTTTWTTNAHWAAPTTSPSPPQFRCPTRPRTPLRRLPRTGTKTPLRRPASIATVKRMTKH